jgi:hypothetical protein
MFFIVLYVDEQMIAHDSGFFWVPSGRTKTLQGMEWPSYDAKSDTYMVQILGYRQTLGEPRQWGANGRIAKSYLKPKAEKNQLFMEVTLGGGEPAPSAQVGMQ